MEIGQKISRLSSTCDNGKLLRERADCREVRQAFDSVEEARRSRIRSQGAGVQRPRSGQEHQNRISDWYGFHMLPQ